MRPLGIPFPEGRFATGQTEVQAAGDALGYPVVLKAQAAALGHKSDAGGVKVGLKDSAELCQALRNMVPSVREYDPSIALDGFLVEKMGRMGTEMIVGAKHDPQWGPVVLAGFGGVTAEILKDVKLFTPDLGVEQVKEGLLQLKQAPILKGWRGASALDVDALAGLIVTIGQIMVGNPSIREIDLNPVIVHPAGEGVVALDALMLVD